MTKGRCTKCWSALIPTPEDGTTNSCCLAAHHLKMHLQAHRDITQARDISKNTLLSSTVVTSEFR